MPDMPKDSGPWRRLAQYVEERRGARGWTQADVARRGDFSIDRVQELEKGERTKYRVLTLGSLERGLEWAPGSVYAVLRGEEPTPLELGREAAPQPMAAGHIELSGGATVTPPSKDEEVIRARRRPEWTEEEYQARLRIARELFEDEDE